VLALLSVQQPCPRCRSDWAPSTAISAVVHCLILPNRSFCLSVEPLQRCVSSNFFACEVKWEQFHPIFTHLPAEHGVALSQTSTSAPWSWARARSDQASVDDKRVGHIFRGRLDRTKCTREQGRRKRV